MKDENKEFYTEGVAPEVIDMQLEAFDELVEDVMLDVLDEFKHMTAKEKIDAKKYRNSAKGKKAIAKHLKKAARAGYKIDKALSKKMKKVAAFRNEEFNEEWLDNLNLEDAAIIEAIIEALEVEEKAYFENIIEEIVAFAEADIEANGDETSDDGEVDPETGEQLDEFKHMTAAAKMKAKKYRNSAAGKRARRNYLKKASRAGYRVDKKRSKLMTKMAKFRHEDFEADYDDELDLTEAEIEQLDEFIADIIAAAPILMEACKDQMEEDDDAEDSKRTIMIPVDGDEAEIEAAAEKAGVEIVSKEEADVWYVCGEMDELREFLDELGYENDTVEDLEAELDEFQVHHQTSAEKLAAKKYRMSAAGKKAIRKHKMKAARAGYRVDKALSKKMQKVAKLRREAVEESINEQIAASSVLGNLNEAESLELKSMLANAVHELLEQASERIFNDVTEAAEDFISNEIHPFMADAFEAYKEEIQEEAYRHFNGYIGLVAEDIVEQLSAKKVFVKSQQSEALEDFSAALLDLIKDKLQIIPEQEDALFLAKQKADELRLTVEESAVDVAKMKDKLEEARREAYIYKNLPSNLSEATRENLVAYAQDELAEDSFANFAAKFDSAINEAVAHFSVEEKTPAAPVNESVKDDKKFDELAIFKSMRY